MAFKKVTFFFLSIFAIAGASFCLTACGEKSDADKAADAVEDAGNKASDAVKGITQ
mgnify:FL=1